MRLALAAAALAACHSTEPVVQVDASSDAPPPITAKAMLVQHVDVAATAGDAATIAFAPTSAGDFVIVVVGLEGSSETHVDTVRGADRDFTLDSSTLWSPCGKTFEVWSLRDVPAGLASVDVTLTTTATRAISVFEVSGVSAYPFESSANYIAVAGFPPPPAPVVTALDHDFIVALVWTCGEQPALEPGSAMTPLPLTSGVLGAYMISSGPGTYASPLTFTGDRAFTFAVAYR